jgi:hypothetical protein
MPFNNGRVGVDNPLTALFDKVASDGRITESEGNQLADKMKMNQGAFWSKFDLNNNKFMSGKELQSVGNHIAAGLGKGMKYIPGTGRGAS